MDSPAKITDITIP